MVDYNDPDFDPNTIAHMDPSQWDMDSHNLAIQGGIEDPINNHVQTTGQLPDTNQTGVYVNQAIQDQMPYMNGMQSTVVPPETKVANADQASASNIRNDASDNTDNSGSIDSDQ